MTNTAPAPLVYKDIEITAANYRAAMRHIAAEVEFGQFSDLFLHVEIQFSGSRGGARAAAYLLEIPAEHRAAAESEGNIISNTVPGFRYADGVWEACNAVKRGRLDFPYTAANRRMLADERELSAAAGRRVFLNFPSVA